MAKFFIRYLLFPISLVLAGAIYALIISNPEIHVRLGMPLTDALAFFTSLSVLAGWIVLWEWNFRSESFGMNRHQFMNDLLFALANGMAVGVGHVLVLSIPGDVFLGAWVPVAELPWFLQVVMIVVIMDFFYYWIHRSQHELGSNFWWGIHRSHHTPARFNMMMGPRNHAVDAFISVFPLAIARLVGFSDAAMFWGMWYPGMVAALHHANLDMRLGWFNYLIPGPEVHRGHHAYDPEEGKNYALVLPMWDWLFGTLKPLRGPNEIAYGSPEGDDSVETILDAHLYPVRALLKKPVRAKKILIKILAMLRRFRLWRLKVRGKTMDDVHAQRVQSGKTWDEFCDTLKAAGGNLLHGQAPKDPYSQAEGYRYLSRLVRGGLEAFVEFNDPEFPVLKRMAHETVKLGSDNPDNYYQNTQINSDYDYRITGHRGTVFYLGFFTQNGSFGSTGGLSFCDALEAEQMNFEEDGTFELIISKEKKGKNWLKTEPETTMLMVRQTFMDRKNEQIATMHIECIGGPKAPGPLSPKQIDQSLDTASTFVAGASFLFAKWANGFKKNHPNQLPRFDQKTSDNAGGDKNIAYYHSYWKLEQDEALVIEVMPPVCRLWNFQVNNYWMESLDYRYHTIHINKHTAEYEKDGSVRVIVTHKDPGLKNWLTTDGHFEGTMLWRWSYAEAHPDPQCRVMKLAELEQFRPSLSDSVLQ